MDGYRKFLEEAPESALTPEAMRRLADLKLEKEYGILGDGEIRGAARRPSRAAAPDARAAAQSRHAARGRAARSESEQEFERRAAARRARPARATSTPRLALPGGQPAPAPSGPLEAIALYDQILATYPDYPHNDQVLYQKARAFDELGRTDEAIAVIEQLIAAYPDSRHIDEVQFRRAEYFFTRKKFLDAEKAYAAITRDGRRLRVLRARALQARLDLLQAGAARGGARRVRRAARLQGLHRVRLRPDERRGHRAARSPTPSASSASASRTSAGPRSIAAYFAANGRRGYEDRIYSHLGEFYLEKLRYQDAADEPTRPSSTSNPLHRASPHFSMRVVEIYETRRLPEARARGEEAVRGHATGSQSEYWRHFDVAQSPEVRQLPEDATSTDLANHYHALYQNEELADEKPGELRRKRRVGTARYLASFPARGGARPRSTTGSPTCCSRTRTSASAAREYERTAYDYPEHERPPRPATRRSTRTASTRRPRRATTQQARPARGGRQHAALRRRVPAARARRGGAGRGGRRPLRAEGVRRVRSRRVSRLIDAYPQARSGDPARGVDRRRARLVRDWRLRRRRSRPTRTCSS